MNNADEFRCVRSTSPNSDCLPVTGSVSASAKKQSWGGRALKELAQLAIVGVLAAGSYFLISRFLVQSVTVVGMSMVPTLSDSQRCLLNRWVYHVREPQRNDLVVLRDPLDGGYSVKRVVAVEGEAVEVRSGAVFVNGRRLQEPYLRQGTATLPPVSVKEQSFKCARGQYFVLGDNRNNSIDSRMYGPVPRKNILGLIVR